MAGKRIDYIDYLKGLSITWVVWFHTTHPWFVDFGFRIPLFFFASGIFFKIVPIKTYIQKKTNQLLVPFVFFYLLYYIYLIGQNYLADHSLKQFDFGCIWEVFELHRQNYNFTVNPPLWFICALFCQQVMTYLLVKIFRRRWLITIVAIILTYIGVKYVWDLYTPLMLGRALRYLIYYIMGHEFGKQLLGVVENGKRSSYYPLYAGTLLFAGAWALRKNLLLNDTLLTYIETFGLIVVLIYFFKWIHRFRLAYPFWFFGRNSYIVLGVSEIYQTIFMIIALHLFGEINIPIGFIQTLCTLILLWPTIKILNRKIPKLIGKGVLIDYSYLKKRFLLLPSFLSK
ncbi:MAG: acyltransferase family protein [Muribaculaceae bacterium]|nr:acyltransferase family protein [Muribaculaceae bacterium]